MSEKSCTNKLLSPTKEILTMDRYNLFENEKVFIPLNLGIRLEYTCNHTIIRFFFLNSSTE